jgi:urea transport system ATP-binding protein
MLDVRDLTLHYGQSQILHGLNLSAAPGRVTAVMGTNGVGKTSFLKAIAGRHPRSGGTVLVADRPVGRGAAAAARAGIAYVPQGREIFPLLSVMENLQTGFACLPREARIVPERIFELFPVLWEMRGRRGGDLSGGQQQQLAIGRALVTRPRVLLLDEPTEGIQPNIIKEIGRVIALLRDEGEMALVLVEQYFDFVYGLADSFTAMSRGRAVLTGPKAEIGREALLEKVSI